MSLEGAGFSLGGQPGNEEEASPRKDDRKALEYTLSPEQALIIADFGYDPRKCREVEREDLKTSLQAIFRPDDRRTSPMILLTGNYEVAIHSGGVSYRDFAASDIALFRGGYPRLVNCRSLDVNSSHALEFGHHATLDSVSDFPPEVANATLGSVDHHIPRYLILVTGGEAPQASLRFICQGPREQRRLCYEPLAGIDRRAVMAQIIADELGLTLTLPARGSEIFEMRHESTGIEIHTALGGIHSLAEVTFPSALSRTLVEQILSSLGEHVRGVRFMGGGAFPSLRIDCQDDSFSAYWGGGSPLPCLGLIRKTLERWTP